MSKIDNRQPASQDKKAAKDPSAKNCPNTHKGRPKGSKNRKTIVKEIAFEKHTVKIDGIKKSLTTIELVLIELRNQAAQGKPQALRVYEDLFQKYSMEIINESAGVLVAPAEMSPQEWIKEQVERNKNLKSPAKNKP